MGTNGYLFCSPKDLDIIVSTNARFLEEDYIINHKSISIIILKELMGGTDNSNVPMVQVEQPQVNAQLVTNTTRVSRRSGRVIEQLERFVFVGESLDLAPREHYKDPRTYEETLQDKDANM